MICYTLINAKWNLAHLNISISIYVHLNFISVKDCHIYPAAGSGANKLHAAEYKEQWKRTDLRNLRNKLQEERTKSHRSKKGESDLCPSAGTRSLLNIRKSKQKPKTKTTLKAVFFRLRNFPPFMKEKKGRYLSQNSLSAIAILNQPNSFQTSQGFSNTHFNIKLSCTFSFHKWSPSFKFFMKNFGRITQFPQIPVFHLLLSNLFWFLLWKKTHKLCSFRSCNCFHPSVTFPLTVINPKHPFSTSSVCGHRLKLQTRTKEKWRHWGP